MPRVFAVFTVDPIPLFSLILIPPPHNHHAKISLSLLNNTFFHNENSSIQGRVQRIVKKERSLNAQGTLLEFARAFIVSLVFSLFSGAKTSKTDKEGD